MAHVPEERVQNRDGEQTVVVPVPQIMDAIGEVTERAPERMHSRVVEHIVGIAVPLILEKIAEMIQLVPLERIKDQIVEQIVEVTQPVHKERVQNRVGEQIGGVSAPDQGGFCEWFLTGLRVGFVAWNGSWSRSGVCLCHRS